MLAVPRFSRLAQQRHGCTSGASHRITLPSRELRTPCESRGRLFLKVETEAKQPSLGADCSRAIRDPRREPMVSTQLSVVTFVVAGAQRFEQPAESYRRQTAQFGRAVPLQSVEHRQQHPQTSQQGRFGEGSSVSAAFHLPTAQTHQHLPHLSRLWAILTGQPPNDDRRHGHHHEPPRQGLRRLLLPAFDLLSSTLEQLVMRLNPPTPVIPQSHRRRCHRSRQIGQQQPTSQDLAALVANLADHQTQFQRGPGDVAVFGLACAGIHAVRPRRSMQHDGCFGDELLSRSAPE